jgi:Tfp pilus assembly protein PilP
MSARTTARAVCALALLLVAVGLTAQAPSPSPAAELSNDPAALAPPAEVPDLIKSIIEQEIQPAPGAYTYVPANRRDPFVSLIKPIDAATRAAAKKPGMEGFLIQEVALRGVVRTQGAMVAMFQGPDGKSYFVKAGQRLFDGSVISVDAAGVLFRQELVDPLSPVKTREFRKTLNNETEEARQ